MMFLELLLAGYLSLTPLFPSLSDLPRSMTESNEATSPRIFTDLTLKLYPEHAIIVASVKNSFTLFPSTVPVHLELYSSEQYTTSYQAMTMRSHSYIGDLNMGETLETSCPTNGETLYWLARVRYNEDGGEWKESVTETVRYDGEGKVLPIG